MFLIKNWGKFLSFCNLWKHELYKLQKLCKILSKHLLKNNNKENPQRLHYKKIIGKLNLFSTKLLWHPKKNIEEIQKILSRKKGKKKDQKVN